MNLLPTPNQTVIASIEAELKYRREMELSEEFLKENGEEYIKLKEAELELKRDLPHLYGYAWYPWALKFFESTNKMCLLTAGNQSSKSSTQIRKVIHWATATELWPLLWPDAKTKPNMFWYLYPTSAQCTIEFETKWKEFLPKGRFKDDVKYGWKEEYKNKEIYAIHFNTGLTVYFKSYKQGAEALQTGTVFYVACDEEPPVHLYDELSFRIQAVNGFFSAVFTATIGDELWRMAMEPNNKEEEKFPQAFKQQVSLYDCMTYVDGTPSQWSQERIAQVIATCKSQQEVQKRVFGKFIRDSGSKYPQFSVDKHFIPGHHVPKEWFVYVAVDIGSGGDNSHPSGILFLAVRPDYKAARVFATWRGDGIRTTASDVLNQCLKMEKELNVEPVTRFYDWASAEFGEIASRNGIGFVRADKNHERGETVVNVLFRNNMLKIYEQSENGKLVSELCSVTNDRAKRSQLDELADCLRYCCVGIAFDWSELMENKPASEPAPEKKLSRNEQEVHDRRKAFEETKSEESIEDEFSAYNALYSGEDY